MNEHHQNAYGMMPSPNLMVAALARRTDRAALVVLGNSLALYNPPIRVAEEMAMLDVLSAGRLIAGFPNGYVIAGSPRDVARVVLVCPTGLWLDAVPIPDFFTFSPEQLVRSALHDPSGPVGTRLLAEMRDPDRRVEWNRCLASAAKFLWPIPDKGLKKRIHRLTMPTLVVWGASDGLIPTAYAHAFAASLPNSQVAILNGAGHLPMFEQREAFVSTVSGFLAG